MGGFGGRLLAPHLVFRLGAQSLCPATRRPLWRAGKAAAAVLLRQKSVLNLREDFVEPLFRALGFLQASAILRAADPVKAEFKEKLAKLIEA